MIADHPPPDPQLAQTGSWRWLVLALTLVLLQAVPNLSYPIGRDQATYCVIGQGLLHGQRLYLDLWDNKPPGIFYIYAIIVKIFGPAMWSIGLLDILWLLAISICIFRFTHRTLGKTVAILAVLVNAAMHIRAGYWDAGQPETLVMLFIFGSYFLLSDPSQGRKIKALGAGALFAASFWVKYNAAAFLPFLLVMPFLQLEPREGRLPRIRLSIARAQWLATISGFAAGFLLLSAGLLSGLLISGSWSGFVEEQFEVLPRYAAEALTGNPHYWRWAAGQIQNWLGLWTLFAMLAGLIIAWKRHQLSRLAPAMVGAAAGFVALAVQFRYQPYYFETCYPFLAIFWGYVGIQTYEGAHFLAQYFLNHNWRVARVLTWVVFANVMTLCLPGPITRIATNYKALNEWRQDQTRFYSDYSWPGAAEDLRDLLRVVDFIKNDPASRSGVYVWGNEPLIYYLSGRRPPARFVWNLALVAPWRLPGWREELVRRLAKSRPRFIVVARNDEVHDLSGTFDDSAHSLQDFPGLRNYVHDFYQPCEDDLSFEIYCRTPGNVAASSARPPS